MPYGSFDNKLVSVPELRSVLKSVLWKNLSVAPFIFKWSASAGLHQNWSELVARILHGHQWFVLTCHCSIFTSLPARRPIYCILTIFCTICATGLRNSQYVKHLEIAYARVRKLHKYFILSTTFKCSFTTNVYPLSYTFIFVCKTIGSYRFWKVRKGCSKKTWVPLLFHRRRDGFQIRNIEHFCRSFTASR